MMLILSVDTTSERGGAAVFRDGECLAEAPHQGEANYSVSLFEDVERLTHMARIRLPEIDLFAAASGPGSFTGIRVGLAAVQGWAQAFGKPARGASVFEAMIEAAQVRTGRVFPLLDARRGEFYVGAYRCEPGADLEAKLVALAEPAVLGPSALVSYLQEQKGENEGGTVVVREMDRAAQALHSALPPLAESQFEWKEIGSFLVPAIAAVALRAEREQQAGSELSAFYVRRSDAELNWRE